MARVSFRLRSEETEQGSHVRYDEALHGVRTDYDSALRGDGLQVAPDTSILEDGRSSFAASSSCYGEVDLEWDVAGLPRAEDAILGGSPEVTETVLVYSDQGEPQTIASGDILIETSTYFVFKHTGVPEGRWAYYSLFVRYQSSGGDDFYERVASLSVLVPRDYGSTLQLWRRIPEFYRIQDSNMGTTEYSPCIGQVDLSGRVGPLFKYLSIIGFDMDRMRTTIDYTIGARDPDISHTEILDALAEQMAVPMRSSDLGSARLRRVLGDIGEYRRSKGTASALEYLGQAITGGDVEVDVHSGDITIYSQRVNYITDPRDGTGIITHRPAADVELTEYRPFSDASASAYSAAYSVSGSVFSFESDGAAMAASVNHVLVHIASPIPVRPGDRACFSVHSNVGTSAIKWARLVSSAYPDAVLGIQRESTLADGARAFEITAQTGASPGVCLDAEIEILLDLRDAPAGFQLEYLLAELNRLDHYFDGDTKRGGWLIDTSSISDYRWEGSAYSSVSLYAEEYERTNGIIDALLIDEAVPVTEVDSFQIVSYDAVRGGCLVDPATIWLMAGPDPLLTPEGEPIFV